MRVSWIGDVVNRRLAAITSLALLAASVVLAVVVAVQRFPRGLTVLACVVLALWAAWWALVHRGAARFAAAAGAAVLLAGAVVLVVLEGRVLEDVLILAGLVLSLAAARTVFTVHATLPAASAPKRAVLFYNPKSGGGKAERFEVAREARARGVEPIELHLGDDLATLVRDAIANGADAVGVAGGDGTQAIVAAIASERGLPYVCVPAGTRNHFALDLGVDRDDVVGALDAFTNGGERLVDLAEVNGRVFVNNVSLGVYAEAVQREGYRDAKLRTIAETMPTVLGPRWRRARSALQRRRRPRAEDQRGRARLQQPVPARPRDRLRHTTAPGRRRARHHGHRSRRGQGWLRSACSSGPHASFEVRSDGPVAAGIDGEALKLDPPLRFATRPQALRVLIAPQHPGASPSATMPEGPWDAIRAVAHIAAHGSS